MRGFVGGTQLPLHGAVSGLWVCRARELEGAPLSPDFAVSLPFNQLSQNVAGGRVTCPARPLWADCVPSARVMLLWSRRHLRRGLLSPGVRLPWTPLFVSWNMDNIVVTLL